MMVRMMGWYAIVEEEGMGRGLSWVLSIVVLKGGRG